MKTPQERAEELYKYSPNDSIEIPSYIKGRQEERAEWEEKTRWIPVTERLPEDIVKIRTVVADNYRTEEVIVRCTEVYPDSPILTRIMLRAKYYYNGNSEWRWVCPNNTIITHWKEII